MNTPKLGRIRKVQLSDVWPNEASDFTPWVKEQLAAIGDVMGMNFKLENGGDSVDGAPAALLAHDHTGKRSVLIENQLSNTDDNHLGKLLATAAMCDAQTVVWVAQEINEEHAQTLTWLNKISDGDRQFFGIAVEVYKIDDSLPAIAFRLATSPGGHIKAGVADYASSPVIQLPPAGPRPMSPVQEQVSDAGDQYLHFFGELIGQLRDHYRFTTDHEATTQPWASFPSGFDNVAYRTLFDRDDEVRVEVLMNGDRDWNNRVFDGLLEATETIESKIGEPLKWERRDDSNECCIAAVADGTVNDSADKLVTTRKWMINRLLDFKTVFTPRLTDLAR